EIERRYQDAVAAAFQNSASWSATTLQDLLAEARKKSGDNAEAAGALDALKETIEKRRREAAERADRALAQPDQPLPSGLDEELYLDKARTWLSQAPTPEERRRLLDLLCAWPSDRVAPLLADLELDGEDRDRASMILTLRFGHPI